MFGFQTSLRLLLRSLLAVAGVVIFLLSESVRAQSWTSLGSGMNPAMVVALAPDSNGNLYAGGDFTNAGGVSANRVAKWNGSSWTNLGSGLGAWWVYALVSDSAGNVYAGGSFTNAGGIPANRVAKWNGSSWTNLGSGMSQDVKALVVDANDNVYAGGASGFVGGFCVGPNVI